MENIFSMMCRNGSVTLHIIIIKNAGLRSMRVKYKEENSYSVKIVATFRWLWVFNLIRLYKRSLTHDE